MYRDAKNLAGEVRNYRSPNEISPDGQAKGEWNENAFALNDDYVPTRSNPENKTVGEIKEELHNKYGIDLDEIGFNNNEADFSSISVAHIDTKDIINDRRGLSNSYESIVDDINLLESRSANMDSADRIAAENHIAIPGLGEDYSATELKKWRSENHFTWDEQMDNGYNLVPSVVHDNVAHTGAVSVGKNSYNQYEFYQEHADDYSFDEDNAPISYEEAKDYTGQEEKNDYEM